MSARSSTSNPFPNRWPALCLLALGLWPLASLHAAASDDTHRLDWITRADMRLLPKAQRQAIPEWCNGIYYAPRFATPAASLNTVVEADNSSYTKNGLAELSGNITIQQPERFLSADHAILDQQTGDFSMDGNISVSGANESFAAKHLTGNTQHETTHLENVEFSIFSLHARGSAETVERHGNLTYIQRGSYTTCEPGQKGWLLKARRIELDRDKGWGEARDVTLEVRDWPIFYLPWITFPIDDRRKSGLLFPTFASSDEGGLDYTQPIYLNLHPQLDMQISPRFISERGTGVETETRYLTHLGSGQLEYAWMEGDRRTNQSSRQMAQWRHNGSRHDWSFGTDINYVSDDFYFKDLGNNTLDSVAQTELPRSAHLEYSRPTWQFTSQLQSWQIIDPSLPKTHYPYRRLPALTLTGRPDIQGPFKVDWRSNYTYFDRSVELPGDAPVGSRWHANPAMRLPLEKSWGYVTPQLRLFTTYYDLSGRKGLAPERQSRTLTSTSLDTGMYLERNLSLGAGSYLQTLEPRLFYNYIPWRAQDNLPNFDTTLLPFSYTSLFSENRFLGDDRVGDSNKVAAGLTSRLIDPTNGDELLRFRLGQGYYFQKRRVQLLAGQAPETSPTTPIVADTSVQVNKRWSLFAQKQWDNGSKLGKQDLLRIGYADPARRYVYLGYRKIDSGNIAQQSVQQGEIAGMWPVSQHWSLFASDTYNFTDNQSVESVAGLEYRDCCWKLRLVNRRLLADYSGLGRLEARTTTMFQIQLIGLGGFGDKVENLLENAIPGYRRQDQ